MRRQGTALCPAGEKERNSRRHHVVIPKNGDGESVPAAVGGEASGHWVGVLDRLMDRPSQTHQPSPMSHRGRHGPRSARLSPGPGSGEHTRPEGWGGGGTEKKLPGPGRQTQVCLTRVTAEHRHTRRLHRYQLSVQASPAPTQAPVGLHPAFLLVGRRPASTTRSALFKGKNCLKK